MNKIFKVIWNNAKHCYVVASELAKSYSKSGGSRSIRRAMVTLGVAVAVYAAAGSALANSGGTEVNGDYIGNSESNYNVTIDSDVLGEVYGHKEDSENVEEASVTMTDGIVNNSVYSGYSYSGNAASNSVNISGGTVNGSVYGGFVNDGSGNAASNSVNISGATTKILGNIYGGVASGNGNAASNSVTISHRTLNSFVFYEINIYGGMSNLGNATSNSINISCDSIKIAGSLYGGYSFKGNAASNSVNISGNNTQISESVYGGYIDYYDDSNPGSANYNTVNISGGTIGQFIYGGYSRNYTSNGFLFGTSSSSYNIVNISGGKTYGLYGGYACSSGDANENQVTMTGGEIASDSSIQNSGNLYGGYSFEGNATSNSVTISGNNTQISESVFGGYSVKGNAASNSVTINGNITLISGSVYGGYSIKDIRNNSVKISNGIINGGIEGGHSNSSDGIVASNSVTISGGTINGYIYGGVLGKEVLNNSVTISGGIVDSYVYGGYTSDYNSLAASNSVTISGGTINGLVFGGEVNSGSSTATSNIVTISGGTINRFVHGGSGPGNISSNSVNISGGTINNYVFGGYSNSGYIASNSVNISGGTFSSGCKIYGGCGINSSTIIKDNSVNLSGTVTGLDSTEIYGHYCQNSDTYTHSGNELHIGRAVDYDEEGKIKRDSDGNIIYKSDETTIWKGKTSEGTVNNIVGKVANFDTLALHSVAWNTSLPALKASTMGYVETLDITDLKLYGINTKNGTMNLLEWGDVELENYDITNLKYKPSSTGDAQIEVLSDNPIIVYSENLSVTDKGIALEGNGSGSVKKANKAVQYSVTGVTLNSIDLSNWNGETSTITSTWNAISNVPVVTGSFTEPSSVAPGGSMTILTTANGSFIDSNITGANKYGSNIEDSSATKDFTNDADKGVIFTGKHPKGVKASDDNKSLFYAIGAKKYVTDIALGTIDTNEIRNITGADYDFSKVSNIDASNLIISNPEDLNKGTAVNILSNSANLANNPTLSYGENKTSHSQNIEISDNSSGIKFLGSMSGSVSTTSDAIQYTLDNKFVNNIDLANWKQTTFNADLSAWTAADNATIETDGMATPEGVTPGDTITIIKDGSTSGAYLLADMEVTGSLKWQDAGDYKDTAVKGVSVTGTTTGGGVKITDDNKELIYKKANIATDKLKLGQVTFASGGTSRTFTNEYNFSDASIDASNLTFADSTDFLKPSDSMTLADKATGITSKSSITDGTNKAINLSYSDSTSGIAYTAKAFGNVSADTDAVKFTIESVAGESINLAKWNGTTAEFPDVWTANANGVSVSGVFSEPELSAGETIDILTASTAMFKDENIDESIRFKEKGSFKNDSENGVSLSGVQTGGVKASDEGKALTYYALEKTINKFDLADWDGVNSISAGNGWKFAESVSVETDGMSNLPDSYEEKQVFILKSDTEGFFTNVTINGENIYGKKQNKFTDSDEAERVVLTGTQEQGVDLDSDKKNLVYKLGSKDVTTFKLNTIVWEQGAELLNRDKYNYTKLTSLDTKDFNMVFEMPENVAVNQSMTVLKANETLADMAAKENSVSYQYEPLSGVTLNAVIKSNLEAKGGKITLTTVSNKADKLTFGAVDWLDKGALIDHKTMLNNVSFDGAAVDTSKIAFINKQRLDANMQMTLVSDFDGNPGTITGSKYKVGTAYEGEGSAFMDGNNLVFKTNSDAGLSEETHSAVMTTDASIAMLTTGNDHVVNAIEGLGLYRNTSAGEVSTFASMGGGSSRYKTGSHVDTNSWNCTLAVGKNIEKKDGTMEYGLFAEYGRGNYTLHMDGVEDGGSGHTHYTGGGLLMKWTNSHDVYTEASFRMGNMKDKTSNILHDGAANAYGYDTNAKYRGGHFGIGKICREEGGTKLEIYGKYFYNQREGINFAAGADQYSLDEVRSRVLRAGFRYSTSDKKWNRYGGVAFDREFGGKANGTVNGTAIRSASIKGGTLRGEFGYCREATKTNPWKTDISLFGFTGKRNGFGGSVAVEYHF